MKPVRLEMEGFGSYLEHTVLDFEKINKGLYLITGPTGSGKTTIFDAISYALYGVPSGSVRSEQALRSKNASLQIPTYVDLTFTYAEKTYRIRRNPKYIRAAKKGTGTGKEDPAVYLELPDGKVITEIKKADQYIQNDIMRLTKDQFSKIAMLAQGEFQKLLIADTKEKMNIFRQIFRTSIYDTLSGRIFNLLKGTAEKRKVLSVTINEDLKRVPELGLDESLDAKMIDVRENRMSVLDSIEVLTAALETLDKSFNEKREKVNSLGQAELKLYEKQQVLRDYKETKARIDTINLRLPDAIKEAETADKAWKDADTRNGEYKTKLQLELSENERKIEELNQLEKALVSIETDEHVYATNSAKLKRMEDEINDDEKRVAQYQEIIDSIPDRTEEVRNLYLRSNELRSILDKLDDASRSLVYLKKAEEKAEDSKENYRLVFAEYDEARKSYEDAYDIFYSQQAGILAETLVEGEACPVCGSVHHPHKAELKDESITDAELKRREKNKDVRNLRVQDASSASKAAESRCETLREELKEKLTALGIENSADNEVTLSDKRNCISKELSDNQLLTSNYEAEDKSKKKAVSDKETLQESIREKTSDYNTLRSRLDSFIGSLNERKRAYEESAEKFSQYDADALRKSSDGIRHEVNSIESEFKKTTLDKRELDARLERLKTALETESAHLGLLKIDDQSEEDITRELDEITEEKRRESDLQMGIHTNMRILNSICTNLGRNQRAYDEVDSEYRSINSLYETFTGQKTGAKKVGLETYVQMAYFDRILDRANIRLLSMTSHRYEMRREKLNDTEDHMRQKGLDVLIVDHFEGCERAVQTLSGGEKFLASLCLALGLSEEIEAEAGGIHLDSIFIDEGFGSLDSESISLAMKALKDLAGGEKMVGIISHVEALKDRIDNKIIVSRNLKGESRAEIVV